MSQEKWVIEVGTHLLGNDKNVIADKVLGYF